MNLGREGLWFHELCNNGRLRLREFNGTVRGDSQQILLCKEDRRTGARAQLEDCGNEGKRPLLIYCYDYCYFEL